VNDAFPGGILADEILTPGKGQIRALFVTGGNPLLTMANAGRLREAFQSLELLVTVDIYRNETGSLAHYVLPATSPFERADLPFIFPLMLGLQSKPYLQATRPVVRPDGAQRDEASIYLELCRAAGVGLFGSSVAQLALEAMVGVRSAFQGDGEQPGLPQEALLSLLLRLTGQGSFGELLAHPHGRLRPDHAPGSFLGARVLTDDGKVDLAPSPLLAQAARLEGVWEDERREGSFADVSTAVATVRVPVRVLPDLMPGTVALPHGWGHQHATGLSVASKTAGVNVNLLAADGPDRIERLSGMAHLTGFVVDVRPAAGPQDPTSWSGLPKA
jgi:formate dehydrogenase